MVNICANVTDSSSLSSLNSVLQLKSIITTLSDGSYHRHRHIKYCSVNGVKKRTSIVVNFQNSKLKL